MSDLRTFLRGCDDEKWADVQREFALERDRRAPKQEWRDLDNAEFFRRSDELCRKADREKAEAAQKGAADE